MADPAEQFMVTPLRKLDQMMPQCLKLQACQINYSPYAYFRTPLPDFFLSDLKENECGNIILE